MLPKGGSLFAPERSDQTPYGGEDKGWVGRKTGLEEGESPAFGFRRGRQKMPVRHSGGEASGKMNKPTV